MFLNTISDEEFVAQVERLPWAIMDGPPAHMAAGEAFQRGIPVEKLPKQLHKRYRDLVEAEASEVFDPLEWLAQYPEMSRAEFNNCISYLTFAIGYEGISLDENPECEMVDFGWQGRYHTDENPRWCSVTLTRHGVALNDWASLQDSCYTIMGYCLSRHIPFHSHLYTCVDDHPTDADKLQAAIAESRARMAKGLKLV